jgi:hypothetical protein
MEKAGLTLVRTFDQPWPYKIPGHEQGDVEYALTRVGWEHQEAASREQSPGAIKPAAQDGPNGRPGPAEA